METKKDTITDKIIDGLRSAVTELEELHLQAALGKAEARDLYEEAKKKLSIHLHEAKLKIESLKTNTGEEILKIRSAFESLQVQLALGKAETADIFEEQRKKITSVLHELEVLIKKNKTTNVSYTLLLMELEKFQTKLEILRLRYKLKKLDVKNEFEEKKKEFLDKISVMKNQFLNIDKKEETKLEHFQDEIAKAYSHLKKAFSV